jgi:hypothetical protein
MILDGYYDGQVVAQCDETDLKTQRQLLQIKAVEKWVSPAGATPKSLPQEATQAKQ